MKTFIPLTAAAATAALFLTMPASADSYFQANLNAAQAMTNSPGFGVAYFDLLPTGVLNYSFTLQNLYQPGTTLEDPVMMMHFHDQVLPTGVKVQDGPVVHGIYDASVSPLPGTPDPPLLGATESPASPGAPATEFDGNATRPVTFTGTWGPTDKIEPLTPGLVTDLMAGNLYLNVHTATFMDGAIRGQIVQANGPVGPFGGPAVPEAGDLALTSVGLLPLAVLAARRRRA